MKKVGGINKANKKFLNKTKEKNYYKNFNKVKSNDYTNFNKKTKNYNNDNKNFKQTKYKQNDDYKNYKHTRKNYYKNFKQTQSSTRTKFSKNFKKKEEVFFVSLNDEKKDDYDDELPIKKSDTFEYKVNEEIKRRLTSKQNPMSKIHPSWINKIENDVREDEILKKGFLGKLVKF